MATSTHNHRPGLLSRASQAATVLFREKPARQAADDDHLTRLMTQFGVLGGSDGQTRAGDAVDRRFGDIWSQYLSGNPAQHTQDIYAKRSSAMAHGIVWARSDTGVYDLCDEMVQQNTTLSHALELLVAQILRRGGEFVVTSEHAKDKRVQNARDLAEKYLLNGDSDFGWHSMEATLLRGMLLHGFSVNEMVWEFRDGKILAPTVFLHRHPTLFGFDGLGRLRLETAATISRMEATAIPDGKFALLRRQAMYGNPFGHSAIFDLRYLYIFGKEAMKAWADFIETYGAPLAVARLKGGGGALEKLLNAAKEILGTLRRRTGVILPEGIDLEFQQRSAGQGTPPQSAFIQYIDRQMARSLLGGTLQTMEAEHGSRAQADSHGEQTQVIAAPYRQALVATVNNSVTDPFLVRNFGPDMRGTVKWQRRGDEDKIDIETALKIIRSAVDNGAPFPVRQFYEWTGASAPEKGEPILVSTERPSTDSEDPTVVKPEDEVAEVVAFAEADARVHEHASTQFDLPPFLADLCREWAMTAIPESDLYTETREDGSTKYGTEQDPHVTLLYGIDADGPELVQAAIGDQAPVRLHIGPLQAFTRPGKPYDVLYASVAGPDVHRLRRVLEGKVAFERTQPGYTPHVTVAYLKRGAAEKYLRTEPGMPSGPLDGVAHTVRFVTFSGRDGTKTAIKLTGSVDGDKDGEGDRAATFAESPELLNEYTAEGDAARERWADQMEAIDRRMRRKMEAVGRSLIADGLFDVLLPVLGNVAGLMDTGEDEAPPSIELVAMTALDSKTGHRLDQAALRLVGASWLIGALHQDLIAAELGEDDAAEFADPGLPEALWEVGAWLRDTKVLSESELQAAVARLSRMRGSDPVAIERNLRAQALVIRDTMSKHLTANLGEFLLSQWGEANSASDFVKRLKRAIGATDVPRSLESYWRLVFDQETLNQQAREQQERENDPYWSTKLWGWRGYNPVDERSHPGHAFFKGVYYRRGSEASAVLGSPPFTWRCRCKKAGIYAHDPTRTAYRESANAMEVAIGIERYGV